MENVPASSTSLTSVVSGLETLLVCAGLFVDPLLPAPLLQLLTLLGTMHTHLVDNPGLLNSAFLSPRLEFGIDSIDRTW